MRVFPTHRTSARSLWWTAVFLSAVGTVAALAGVFFTLLRYYI